MHQKREDGLGRTLLVCVLATIAAPLAHAAEKEAWSLAGVRVSKKFGSWTNPSCYVETQGVARFRVEPPAGEELVAVSLAVTASVADPNAIAKLTTRRVALAKTVPLLGDALLVTPQQIVKLIGAYRMFDMDDFTLTLDKKLERRALWSVEPQASGFFVTGGTLSTGGWPCKAPWHLAQRTSTSFTGLLEIEKPVAIVMLFSVPRGTDLKAASLRIAGQEPITAKVSDKD